MSQSRRCFTTTSSTSRLPVSLVAHHERGSQRDGGLRIGPMQKRPQKHKGVRNLERDAHRCAGARPPSRHRDRDGIRVDRVARQRAPDDRIDRILCRRRIGDRGAARPQPCRVRHRVVHVSRPPELQRPDQEQQQQRQHDREFNRRLTPLVAAETLGNGGKSFHSVAPPRNHHTSDPLAIATPYGIDIGLDDSFAAAVGRPNKSHCFPRLTVLASVLISARRRTASTIASAPPIAAISTNPPNNRSTPKKAPTAANNLTSPPPSTPNANGISATRSASPAPSRPSNNGPIPIDTRSSNPTIAPATVTAFGIRRSRTSNQHPGTSSASNPVVERAIITLKTMKTARGESRISGPALPLVSSLSE